MIAYTLAADDGKRFDSKFEIDSSGIVLHSRGGTKGKDAINPDYSKVLRTLLRRLGDHKLLIAGAWVVSHRVQNLAASDREILANTDADHPPEELFRIMTSRMQKVGRGKDINGVRGNPTKRVRIQLQNIISDAELASALQATAVDVDLRSQKRLPAEDLNKITSEHVWNAVQLLLNGTVHSAFGKSTDFDLIADDGTKLPPKAVFGMAGSEALGFKVLPKHFSGGEGTPCFRILRAAGYLIERKQGQTQTSITNPLPADEQWTEGKSKLVSHVEKERGRGMARAKKAQFRRLHGGKLFCEKCKIDPVETYQSEHGEACIEVHHQAIQVQNMNEGHTTKLADLQCLCANCHRLEHRLLKASVSEGVSVNGF